MTDFVAEVGDDESVAAGAELAPAIQLPGKGWSGPNAAELRSLYAKHAFATGGGRTMSFSSLRRFCAIAASVNSN